MAIAMTVLRMYMERGSYVALARSSARHTSLSTLRETSVVGRIRNTHPSIGLDLTEIYVRIINILEAAVLKQREQ